MIILYLLIQPLLLLETTMTLPSSPLGGESYEIKDSTGSAATYNITVSGNGKNIDGNSTL